MKHSLTSISFAVALAIVSLGFLAPLAKAQSSFPVKILVPEKMPVQIEFARVIKFENKYILNYRIINRSGHALTTIGMDLSVSKPDGRPQIQHMWLRDKLQIESAYEDSVAIPTELEAGTRLALSVHYVKSGSELWEVDLPTLNRALWRYQETGAGEIPKATLHRAK